MGGTTWEIGGARVARLSTCATCTGMFMRAPSPRLTTRRRLRVYPLMESARCAACGDQLEPDVGALRLELARRANDLAGLTSAADEASHHLIFRRCVDRYALLAIQRLADAVMRHEPDETLTRQETGQAYLLRWWLHRQSESQQSSRAIYLHSIVEPDLPAPHDHPWRSCALVVRGIIGEDVFDAGGGLLYSNRLHPGDVVEWSAEHRHLLRPLETPARLDGGGGAVTVFATGTRCRQWGFIFPDGTTGRDRAHGLTGRRADLQTG